MAQPLTPWSHASGHQPSRIEQLSTPFIAAFMPDVPHASSGRLRRVEPHVDAAREEAPERKIVVRHEDDRLPG